MRDLFFLTITASLLKIEMVVEGTILEVKRPEPLNLSLDSWGCHET